MRHNSLQQLSPQISEEAARGQDDASHAGYLFAEIERVADTYGGPIGSPRRGSQLRILRRFTEEARIRLELARMALLTVEAITTAELEVEALAVEHGRRRSRAA